MKSFGLKFRLSLLLPFLTVVFVMSSAVPAQAAPTKAKLNAYSVQLLGSDPSILNDIAQDITLEFPSSPDKQFQNIYSFNSNLSQEQLGNRLMGQIVYLEEDQIFSTSARIDVTPNDPGYTTRSSHVDKQWGLAKAKFREGWRTTTGSPDTVVAVIDTGVDSTHEDLIDSKFVDGYNIITGKKISAYSNSDDNGHGTLVAGVIGATSNNKQGIAGATRDVTLMAVKALNSKGSGTASQISSAIVWATDNGADVINLSLGGIGFAHNNTLANAITYAFDKNVVIVAAAGNDVAITGGNLDVEPVFPICNDNGQNMVIGVSATDNRDLKPDFANYGKACVDVVAPGKRILSTINRDPITRDLKPDSYAYASGTSLSVPFVTAQAALLRSLYPTATNRQIRDRIISTADSVDRSNSKQCANKSCAGFLGSGRINVKQSLDEELPTFRDGDVVEVSETGDWYYINGSKRQYISRFVKSQRFAGVNPKPAKLAELIAFSEGSYALPHDGTLVKDSRAQTVYYISKGLRLPVTALIFQIRDFKYSDIVSLGTQEINSWLEGSFLPPQDGSLVRTAKNPTVYWVVDGVLHPVNQKYYVDKGLSVFPVVYVNDDDVARFTVGESFVF